jgi:hypothetical protein
LRSIEQTFLHSHFNRSNFLRVLALPALVLKLMEWAEVLIWPNFFRVFLANGFIAKFIRRFFPIAMKLRTVSAQAKLEAVAEIENVAHVCAS